MNIFVKIISFIIILAILIIFYEKYKITAMDKINVKKYPHQQEPQKMLIIEKYIFNKNREFEDKPFIWLHIDYDVNSREWLDFGSRNTKNLNRPYIQLCLQQIIKINGRDFNVVIIDDTSFKDLIPRWDIDLVNLPDPVKTHIRTLSLIKLLYHYGGIICPVSFFSIKNFKNLYNDNSPFVCEARCHTESDSILSPSVKFMAGKKMDMCIKKIMTHVERLQKSDYYTIIGFFKNVNSYIKTLVDNNEVKLIDGKQSGIKTKDNKNIFINELVENSEVKLSSNAVGVHIPQDELEKHTNYNWFSYISVNELVASNTFMGDLFRKYYDKNCNKQQ